ncbi:hypothetical protein [Salibacterium lacus]|uniref:Phage tail tape measure protein n=1 Tax=Salibacterium lacus TaxID=1898109 RepID=A0ABW5SY35_9BACI
MAYDLTAHLRLRDSMSGKLRNVSKNARDVNRSMQKFNDTLGFTAEAMARVRRVGTIVSGVLAGIPATVGPATVSLFGLASSFSAAGAGAVGFGAVATSAIGNVIEKQEEISDLQDEINNASSASARADAQAELQQALEGVSGAQRGAIKSLTEFKSWWDDFVSGFEQPVFRVFREGLDLIRNTMEALKPSISETGRILGDFLARVNRSFQTDQVQSFFDYLNGTVSQGLNTILTVAGDLFVGFMEILKAFAPVSTDVGNGLENLTGKFRSWAAGLSESDGFQRFVEYARKNGPTLLDAIGNIVGFVRDLMGALAPLSSAVLQIITDFGKWLNTSDTAKQGLDMLADAGTFLKDNLGMVKTAIMTLIGAIAGIKIIGTIVTIVSAGIAIFRTLRTVLMAVRGAMLFVNLAMRMNPIGAIITLISGLVMAGIYLWNNWDEGRKAVKRLWSGIKSAFSKIWSKTKEIWQNVKESVSNAVTRVRFKILTMKKQIRNQFEKIWSKTKEIWNNVKQSISDALKTAGQKVSNFFDPLLGFISDVKGAWKSFTDMLSNFSMPEVNIPGSGMVQGAWNAVTGGGDSGTPGWHGMTNVPYNGFHARLHKGEMVVPRQEAKVLRGDGGAIGGMDDVSYRRNTGRPGGTTFGGSGGTAASYRGNTTAGGGSTSGTGNVNVSGNTFYVREEADIDKITKSLARELRTAEEGGA